MPKFSHIYLDIYIYKNLKVFYPQKSKYRAKNKELIISTNSLLLLKQTTL